MTEEQQLEAYLNYVVISLGLKYNFNIIDLTKDNSIIGRGPVDKTFGNTGIKYLWKDLAIISSFPEFKQTNLAEHYYSIIKKS